MQNKIYTILANLYNELKAFKGDKGSIDNAVKGIVNKHPEVIEARGGYNLLNDRLNDLQEKISVTKIDVADITSKIDNAKTEIESKIPDKVTTVISDETRDILVSLDNKVAYKEDIITLLPGANTILDYNSKHSIAKAYMSTIDSTTALKSVLLDTPSKVNYNTDKNLLSSSCIIPKTMPEMYELPLQCAYMFHSEEIDACILSNLGKLISDYSSTFLNEDGSINYSNHMINMLRGDNQWVVKRSYLSLNMVLVEPVELSKLMLNITSNSSLIKGSFDVSLDGNNWSNILGFSESIDNVLSTSVKAKYIKITVDVFDGVPNRTMTLRNLRLFTTSYNTLSEYVSITEPVILDYNNTAINIKLDNLYTPSKYITNKYALMNASDDKFLYSYIPKSYNVLPEDFRDSNGNKWVNDDLKNNIKIDVNTKVTFIPDKANNLTSVQGILGTCTITKEMTYTKENSWKPKTNNIYVVYLIIKGSIYQVPLHINSINKDIKVTVGGQNIVIRINILNNNAIMVHISSATVSTITVDSVRVDIMSAYDFVYNNKPSWNDGSFWSSGYNNNQCHTSITQIQDGILPILNPINMYTVDNNYDIRSTSWYYDFNNSQKSSTSYSSYNLKESGCTVAIIPNDALSGTEIMSKSIEQPMYKTTIEKRGCTLPVSVYMSCDGASSLRDIIVKSSTIIANNQNPIFSFEQEYISKTFLGKSILCRITPQQVNINEQDIQYSISFDGYSYYALDGETLKWFNYFDKGMTFNTLKNVNDTLLESIRSGSEWLYIKVKILNPTASVKNITLSFDRDTFILIDKKDLLEKGMSKRVLESINADTMNDKLLKGSPALLIASIAKSEYKAYSYKLSGYNIYNHKDVRWQEIDNLKIKEYLLGDGTLMYKNDYTQTLCVKVLRSIVTNPTAVIDARNDVKIDINTVKNEQIELNNSMELIKQNLSIMHDTFLSTGTVPSSLPHTLLPSIKEYDIPLLTTNSFYKISDIPTFRGIQLWEEQTSFIGYSEKLLFEKGTANDYVTANTIVDDSGACIARDYDRDNPYLCPEGVISNSGALGPVKYSMYDMTCTVAPTVNNLTSMIEDGGLEKVFTWLGDGYSGWNFGGSRYNIDRGYTSMWDLPGESTRYVDIILDFRGNTWINYINNIYAGQWSPNGHDSNLYSCSNQITTFSYSLDGKEYIDVDKMGGVWRNKTVTFEKELRYIRIRLENPYSVNKGAGRVTFTQMDIYFSPTRFVHDTDCYVYNIKQIDTSNWSNFNQILVDRYIDHNPCEMKFLLSDDAMHSTWKYWDGSKWCSTTSVSMNSSMSIETLLSLSAAQLNKLTKGSLHICAIMKTTDTYKTPILRSVEFLHDQFDTDVYYDLIDPHSLDIKYSNRKKELIIKNTSNGNKKLKLMLL